MFPPRLVPDRRLAIAGLVVLASAALLAAGLFGIIAALSDDALGLPSEGSLEEMLADGRESGQADSPLSEGEAVQQPSGPRPVAISIPRLYVEASVKAMGLDEEGNPQVPGAPDIVAWYTFSAPPGQGSNAVFSGHVDWYTYRGEPMAAVFYRLRELEIGDTITLRLEDGATLTYRVTGNVAIPYDDPNVVKVMGPTRKDVITLITCGGTWNSDPSSPLGGNYSHRIIVRAERVTEAVSGGAGEG